MNKPSHPATYLWPAAATVAGLLLTCALAWQVQRNNERATLAAMNTVAQQTTDTMLERLTHYQYGLRGARGSVVTAGENNITRALFHRYSQTRDLPREFPGAGGFGFIRVVPAAQEAAFVAAVQRDGRPDYQIHQMKPHAGDRWAIQYIEPTPPNSAAVGLDIASEDKRRDAAAAAMRSGEATLTAPVTLVQTAGKVQQSFLFLLPIYRTDLPIPTTPEAREHAIAGWAYAPLFMGNVLGDLGLNPAEAQFVVSDVTDAAHPVDFFKTGTFSAQTQRTLQIDHDVFGRRWQVTLNVYPAFADRINSLQTGWVLATGACTSLLLGLLTLAGGQNRTRKRQLRVEQARLAAIVESSIDGIIAKDLSGTVVSWNHGAELVFGYTAEQAVGTLLADLIIPAELQGEEADVLRRIALGEFIPGFETRRRRRDGRIIAVSVSISPIRNADGVIIGASKTVRDITAQKVAEAQIHTLNANLENQVTTRTAELSAANALLGSVLRSASQTSILATDAHGIITVFNEGAQRMLGYRAEEVIGHATPEWFHVPEEIAARRAQLSAQYGEPMDGLRLFFYEAEKLGVEHAEWTYVRKNGTHFPMQIVVTTLRDEHGNVTGFLGMGQDISVRREFEANLLNAKQQAEQASVTKSQFLANMSHEIRTPMNAVLGMLQLVRQTGLNDRQTDYISKAQHAAQSLLGLLNDILDFSKIDAGKLQLETHPFELEHLMRDLAVILAGSYGEKTVEVMFELDPGLPAVVLADRLRLQQVLINLAGNALKFTDHGHVIVGVETVAHTPGHTTLCFSVRDTGIGIEATQLQQIFDGFTQAEASTSRRFGGTGLGLAISKRLVGLMGGDLQVESTVGRGSRFWFEVTFAIASEARLVPSASSTDRPLHVLVVDDNALVGQILMQTLVAMGWTAEYASGGQAAIDQVHDSNRQPYDVVLMDWRMPDVDGATAASAIQHASGLQPPPMIIMVTAYGREMLGDLQGESPFLDYLTKPVTPQQLIEAVQHAVGSAPQAREVAAPVAGEPLAGLRILVVEDNMLNRQVAYELLRFEGAEVELAEGGLQGVEMALGRHALYDLIIMDVQMPDIDGLTATRPHSC